MSVRFTARKATSAANDDSSARIFKLANRQERNGHCEAKITAAQGVCRFGKIAAKMEGSSPSRAIENARRDAAISVTRTVLAVANNAIALSAPDAPGHALCRAIASGASLPANSVGEARATTANATSTYSVVVIARLIKMAGQIAGRIMNLLGEIGDLLEAEIDEEQDRSRGKNSGLRREQQRSREIVARQSGGDDKNQAGNFDGGEYRVEPTRLAQAPDT